MPVLNPDIMDDMRAGWMLWLCRLELVQNAGKQVEHRNPWMQETSLSQDESKSATAGLQQ